VYKLESLSADHDRQGFDCGSEPLNSYLRKTARQHQTRGISTTYVLVEESAPVPKAIVGFFTVNICQVLAESLPEQEAKKLPRNVSAVKLGRLAVASDSQKSGVGKILIAGVMQTVLSVFDKVGGIGLFVDAKDERPADYYKKFGFVPLPERPLELFLPIKTIQDSWK